MKRYELVISENSIETLIDALELAGNVYRNQSRACFKRGDMSSYRKYKEKADKTFVSFGRIKNLLAYEKIDEYGVYVKC